MVHIMLAAYNGDKYIREQIDSIISQTYKEWKLFISDDSNTDDLRKIICDYVDKYSEKIILLPRRKAENGAKGNFAYLFKSVGKADYYAFCDQDDIWTENKLECLVNALRKRNSKKPLLIYHDLELIDSQKNIISNDFAEYTGVKLKEKNAFQQLLMYNCIPGCSMVFNNALKKMVGSIPIECIMHDWWLVLATKCFNGEIIHEKKILGSYRQHGNNEIGAVEKESKISSIKRCFRFWKMKKYRESNLVMKNERLNQVKGLLEHYGSDIEYREKKILLEFKNLMSNKNRFRNLCIAEKRGYKMWGELLTIKFYLL